MNRQIYGDSPPATSSLTAHLNLVPSEHVLDGIGEAHEIIYSHRRCVYLG